MAITIGTMQRELTYNGVKLHDPGAEFSVEEIQEMHSAQYPGLLNAIVESEEVGDLVRYKFVKSVSVKG